MSQRTATIESLPMSFEVVKAMRADGLAWGEGYRPLGRQALAEIIQGRMAEAVDDWLDSLDGSAMRDRRTGSYSRHLLTELGDIELSVPRTRRFYPSEVLRSYARRAPEIDRAILAGVVLGLSTRKVGEVLLARLGRKVSASTVSRVAKTLDEAVAAFHARPLADRYKALMLDGVVLARRTGAGALKRPVLALHAIRNAPNRPKALSAARRFASAWEETYPKAVACLRNDLDDLLTCFRYPPPLPSAAVSEPPTPSNDASARSGAGPDPWAHSRTAHQWTASSSPSSSIKTKHRE